MFGPVMPRLVRYIWLQLGKKHSVSVSCLGWKSSNEEMFKFHHSELGTQSVGMDCSLYANGTLKALIECKSNYPMGVEKTILDMPFLDIAKPGIPKLFISVTRNSTRPGTKEVRYKYLADKSGLEMIAMTDKIRSQFDNRWKLDQAIPYKGIIPVVNRLEQIMKG